MAPLVKSLLLELAKVALAKLLELLTNKTPNQLPKN